MTSEEKLELLDNTRVKMSELKEAQANLYAEIREKLGLTERYDRSLWDYLVVGLQFPRRELEVALHTNEGKDA